MSTNSLPSAGFITHWQAIIVLILGLVLSSFVTYQMSMQRQQEITLQFHQDAQHLASLVANKLNEMRQQALFVGKLWPAILDQSAIGEATEQYAGQIMSVEIISLDAGHYQQVPLPEYLTWQSNDKLLAMPDVHTMLSKATALQELVTGPVTRINSVAPEYAGELRWYLPMQAEQSNFILVIGFALQSVLEPISEELQHTKLQLAIHDLEQFSSTALLALGVKDDAPEFTGNEWLFKDTLALAERQWLLQIQPTYAYLAARKDLTAIIVFVAGMLISILSAFILSQRAQQLGAIDS